MNNCETSFSINVHRLECNRFNSNKYNIIFKFRCKVLPLNKPNRPVNDASSKRPISIYSMMRRLFESLVLEKVEAWAENENILSPTQYGFRKGRSTRDCIAILTAEIKIAFQKKMMVMARLGKNILCRQYIAIYCGQYIVLSILTSTIILQYY